MYRYIHVYILMDFFLELSVEEGKDLEAREREREIVCHVAFVVEKAREL